MCNEFKFSKSVYVISIKPETKWSTDGQVENTFKVLEDWTHVCGKIRRWTVGRSERLIKLRNSWFSAKSI